MGATYDVSGTISLDRNRSREFQPILDKLFNSLTPDEYEYDPGMGELHIHAYEYRSHSSISAIDDALEELGKFAVEAAKLDTIYEGSEFSHFWVGPSDSAIRRAKMVDLVEQMTDLARQLEKLRAEAEEADGKQDYPPRWAIGFLENTLSLLRIAINGQDGSAAQEVANEQ